MFKHWSERSIRLFSFRNAHFPCRSIEVRIRSLEVYYALSRGPVTALVNHFYLNNVSPNAPLISIQSASSLRPITYAYFCSFLARVIKSIGLDSTKYSPYSHARWRYICF